jgi:prepilin-type N-terminal cleavage/methylation domain-containing protein
MKINFHSFPPTKVKGFTMLELLVAMSVTVILLGMVTFMTGVSMDGYKGSRDKVLGGRQAKEALEAITQDFEAIVARADGSDNMWLYAAVEPKLNGDTVGNN